MLASGAAVSIGGTEFDLAGDLEESYEYSLRHISDQPEYWVWDDWSGGEGNDAFDEFDPIVYHQGLANPRRIGMLTTPPTRTTFDSGALTPAPNIALSFQAGGRLYVIGEAVSGGACSYWYTTNMTSFTELAETGWNAAVDAVTAGCTDGDNVYLAAWDTAGDYQIRKIVGQSGALSDVRTYANSNTLRIVGLAVLGGFLYTWNGQVLKERSIEDGTSATEATVFTRGGAPTGTWDTDYWAGMVAAENSIFFFTATEGKTTVYEYSWQTGASPIWVMQDGFTGKGIVYSNGAVLIIGEYQGKSQLWGLSTVSRQPIDVGFIRPTEDLDLRVIGTGFGSEVILSSRTTPQVFIYDLKRDAITQLDEFTHASGEIWSCGAYLGFRYVALEDGNDLNIYKWTGDDSPSVSVDTRWESGVTDMGTPEDEKNLEGFHILTKLDANGGASPKVTMFYQDNEDGTWTTAGTATSGFHSFVTEVAAFRTLRIRADIEDGAEVYSISTRYRVNTYTEEWTLLLDMRDGQDQTPGRRSRKSVKRGHQKRALIRDIANNKAIVTFLDGVPYPHDKQGSKPYQVNTHSVNVEILSDQITEDGEGTMLVRLTSAEAV